MMKAKACPIPEESLINAWMFAADFADAYKVPLDNSEQTAMSLYLQAVARTPVWIDAAMRLRNRIVGLVGIKNLGGMRDVGQLRDADCQPGQRVGIFQLITKTPDEVILEDDDKHLTVRVSVLKRRQPDGYAEVVVSTAVHNKNWMGRFYMVFVGPMHKIIAPAVTAKVAGM